MSSNFDGRPKVNISDVLHSEILVESELSSCYPSGFDHFAHEESSENFIVDITFLDVHQSRVSNYSLLSIDALLLSFWCIEKNVVDHFNILRGRRFQ